MRELADRFDQSEFLPQVLGLESLLLKAANCNNYKSELERIQNGCFAPDLNFCSLEKQLPILVDMARQGFVCKATSIRTISYAMNKRTFSVLKGLLVYLQSTMTKSYLYC